MTSSIRRRSSIDTILEAPGCGVRPLGDWRAPIAELVETSEVMLHHDIYHLRTLPGIVVQGRVVLLGDAAHAVTPHLGQGRCQAIEDAVCSPPPSLAHPASGPVVCLGASATGWG